MPDKASLRVWIFEYGDVYLYLKCSSLTAALSAALCQEETQLPFLQVWVLGSGKRAFHMLHESSLASIGNPEVKSGQPATLACLAEAARLQCTMAPGAGHGKAGSRADLQTPRALGRCPSTNPVVWPHRSPPQACAWSCHCQHLAPTAEALLGPGFCQEPLVPEDSTCGAEAAAWAGPAITCCWLVGLSVVPAAGSCSWG